MNKYRPEVFLTRKLPDRVMDRLEETVDLTYNREDRNLTKEEIRNAVADKEGLITLVSDEIDRSVIESGENLKVISNYAVGFNNIDIKAATEHGIAVTNTPDVLTDSTADLAFALILSVSRRVVEADRFVRTGEWKGWAPEQYLGRDVSGSALGVIGFGRIGQAVAERGKAFGMKRIYWNRTRLKEEKEQELGIDYRPLDQLLAEADMVSINVAYNQETHHLIGESELEQMKSTAILVNTARGAVVDEKALVDALTNGVIAGAGLDVYEHEPVVTSELLSMNQVVLLPHLGSATIQTREKMGMIAIENLLAAIHGESIPHLVNKDLLKQAH